MSDTLFGAVDERRYHRGQRAVGRRPNVHLSAGANGTFAADATETLRQLRDTDTGRRQLQATGNGSRQVNGNNGRRQLLGSHKQQETDCNNTTTNNDVLQFTTTATTP